MKNKIVYLIFIIIIIIIILFIIINKNKKNTATYNILELKEGGEEYNSTHLDNFDFEIVDISDEVKKYISDFPKFTSSMKEYLYKNGNIECHEAKCLAYTLKDDIVTIKFKLINDDENRVIAKIYLKDNKYEFVVY